MKMLAIDYGTKRIGLAVSDETETLASPRPYLDAKAPVKLAKEIRRLVVEESIGLVLLGLPKHMDGGLSVTAEKATRLYDALRDVLDVPVEWVDERLTTVQASRQLREGGTKAKNQRERIDSAAAAVMLQAHLDAKAFVSEQPDDEP